MFKILVVEDDKNLRKLIVTCLEKASYTVFETHNGEEALDLMDKEYVDLIVTDIMMPEMDGYELIKSLREANYNTPILIITAKEDIDNELITLALETPVKITKAIDNLRIPEALEYTFDLIGRANKYIDETMPWALAKDETKQDRLAEVLYNLVESITIGANLLTSFMPETSERILAQLYPENAEDGVRDFDDLDKFGLRASGVKVTDKPEILFARLDLEEVLKKAEEIQAAQKTAAGGVQYPQVEEKPEITIDDFDKIQIRVGEVLKCEPVPKAKKLLVSQIRIGDEVRQIVSGIAKYYKPEEMVGKKVAVITNLKPCKLCGVESQGMILAAADDADNLSVLTVDKDMIAGSEIR